MSVRFAALVLFIYASFFQLNIFFESRAWADSKSECADVRLDKAGGSAEGASATLQAINNCAIHASLFLYDAWRFSHREEDKRISSPGKAYLSACEKDTSFGDGIETGDFLKMIKDQPPCALGSIITNPQNKNTSEKIEEFAFNLNQQMLQKKTFGSFYQSVDSCSAVLKMSLQKGELQKMTEAFEKKNTVALLKMLAPWDCSEEDRLPSKTSYQVVDDANEATTLHKNQADAWQLNELKNINDCFDHSKKSCQPFLVNFCFNFLDNPAQSDFIPSNDRKVDTCRLHSIVVIGRRYNSQKKSCELLVRNSFSKTRKYPSPFAETIEDGIIAVDAKAFLSVTYDLNQLQPVDKK